MDLQNLYESCTIDCEEPSYQNSSTGSVPFNKFRRREWFEAWIVFSFHNKTEQQLKEIFNLENIESFVKLFKNEYSEFTDFIIDVSIIENENLIVKLSHDMLKH